MSLQATILASIKAQIEDDFYRDTYIHYRKTRPTTAGKRGEWSYGILDPSLRGHRIREAEGKLATPIGRVALDLATVGTDTIVFEKGTNVQDGDWLKCISTEADGTLTADNGLFWTVTGDVQPFQDYGVRYAGRVKVPAIQNPAPEGL